jgi:DNA-binding CsgD family transcriptional regulator
MDLDTRVSELIKRIYSAATDTSAWDAVVMSLLRSVGACAGIATLIELDGRRLHQCRIYGPQHYGYCIESYSQIYQDDPALAQVARRPEMRFCDSRATLSHDEYRTHPFVQWASTTLGSAYWYAGCSAPVSGLIFCLSAHFNNDRAADPDEVGLLRLLFDHVECAMRLTHRGFSQDSARALIRLDEQGRVEQVSRGAARLLNDRPVLNLDRGRIEMQGKLQQRLVDQALQQVLPNAARVGAPTAIQIKHEQGRPWIIVFRPVAEAYGPFGKVNRRVDVELLDRVPAMARLDVVQSLFDLTGRELQVLRLLAQGHSIDSLSANIEISRNTTRAHLRSIYAKTKTNSQAELMQLCSGLSSAAALGDDAGLELLN